ncbi:MAG: hypothetical protein GF355_18095 [Candidatus Eisenbacteria bacterium]|nr:hypothetical protein [Candidatus Eisenbacteria bacterium]
MKKLAIIAGALVLAGAFTVPASADTLFYFGHGGLNEGHTQLAALYAQNDCGGQFVLNSDATLPTLMGSDYNLVFISVPGLLSPTAYFSAAEKQDISDWLNDSGLHRLVLIGEWVDFYGDGSQVLIDLINDIGVGGMAFLPGGFDLGCYAYNCDGNLGVDPLVDGLDHVCKAATSVWDEGGGAPVAYPFENPNDPWVISNGTDIPCLVALGDSNTLSDGCDHLSDPDTAEFALRLCTINCSGDPVATESSTWGRIKSVYR